MSIERLALRHKIVLSQAAKGLNNYQIGEVLELRERSVARYMQEAFDILGVHNRHDAVEVCKEHNLLL